MAVALWWPMAAWLSPAAAWFVFFNAVVGAIALMSSCSASAHQQTAPSAAARRRLSRSGSSVLHDRFRSFSIFAVHPEAGGVATGPPLDGDDGAAAAALDAHFYCYGTREAEVAAAAAQVIAPEQPERAPQAVHAPAGETAASSAAPPTAPAALPPAEEDHAAPAPAPENENEEKPEAVAEQDESISLDEAYALAQRRRAQDKASAPPPPPASAAQATPATAPARTKKAATEGVTRRRNKAEDALDGKAELNARAELFIRQFREELKLQRLNSILSHAHALRSPTAAAR